MSSSSQTVQTHTRNIRKRNGKKLEEIALLVKKRGLKKEAGIRSILRRKQELRYGQSSARTQGVMGSKTRRQTGEIKPDDILDSLYSGSKASLREIHTAIVSEVGKFGEFELVPIKHGMSLRRKKQFAVVGPAGSKKVELGLNIKDLPPAYRLLEQPRGSEFNYIVKITDPAQVDSELIAWLKFAFEDAG